MHRARGGKLTNLAYTFDFSRASTRLMPGQIPSVGLLFRDKVDDGLGESSINFIKLMLLPRSFDLAEPNYPRVPLSQYSLPLWLLTLFKTADFSVVPGSGYPEAFNPFPGVKPLLRDASSFQRTASFRYHSVSKAFALDDSASDCRRKPFEWPT